jgi:hypothetical protein
MWTLAHARETRSVQQGGVGVLGKVTARGSRSRLGRIADVYRSISAKHLQTYKAT